MRYIDLADFMHSGKSATIQESNHGSGVCMEHYAKYYVPKSYIFLALLQSIVLIILKVYSVE